MFSSKSYKVFSLTLRSLKIIKYLRISLSKEARDLCSENHKMLMKEIKDNTDRWKVIQANLPFELRRKAGDCSRVTAGPIDLI